MSIFNDLMTSMRPLRIDITNINVTISTDCQREAIRRIIMKDISNEQQQVAYLIETCQSISFDKIVTLANQITNAIIANPPSTALPLKFMSEYKLNSDEGLALMSLAEALLRIPDKATMEDFIQDKIRDGDWSQRAAKSSHPIVNLGSLGLRLSKSMLQSSDVIPAGLGGIIETVSKKSIRHVSLSVIKNFANQFILAETIQAGLKKSRQNIKKGVLYSYDMLGEAAICQQDASQYYDAYANAIKALAADSDKTADIHKQPGISVKLSALTPYFYPKYWHKTVEILSKKLLTLTVMARDANIQLTIDAEESWRTELTQAIVERVFSDPMLANYEGFGIVIQSYLVRATDYCHWAKYLAKTQHKQLMVRLVKGAYWDTEIKHAQVHGLKNYPVFTRKCHTDLSYTACAKILIDAGEKIIYPQFATHNTITLATVLELIGDRRDFEVQSIHGMSDHVHNHLLLERGGSVRTRVYAPIGTKKELLAYLVRRIMENGANQSVMSQWDSMTPSPYITNPMSQCVDTQGLPHNEIPLPKSIYPDRINSTGINIFNHEELTMVASTLAKKPLQKAVNTDAKDINGIMDKAADAYKAWRNTDIEARAKILEKAAHNIQQNFLDWVTQLSNEGKKTIDDAVSEVRETIDFLNYYALQARISLKPDSLVGPTGESNELHYVGRGVMVCLSPWNFPMAIFTGQIVAAIVSGNTVVAKPAQQTPMIAEMIVKLLHESGIPKYVLQLVIGKHGPTLIKQSKIDGVMLTGSTETARIIQKELAQRDGPLIPIFAETGGINVMIADSSALREQLVTDVLQSAFRSAGQRCSALRVLYLPESTADEIIQALADSMSCLIVDCPNRVHTDVGPVIDEASRAGIEQHIDWLEKHATQLYRCNNELPKGTFSQPALYKIDSIKQLKEETFGPVLHIIVYKKTEIDAVIDDINNTQYGLTLGIQSRVQSFIKHIIKNTNVGNNYVNRDIIGATVGVQPFGGQGLSGTGPKAGGPNMLRRLCHEKTITVNTTAMGGNASLIDIATK